MIGDMDKPKRPFSALVVDDDALLRTIVSLALSADGFSVAEASSADAAMEDLAKGRSFDLLITDIQMPGTMDGLELAHRAAALYPRMRLIVMSAMRHPLSAGLPHDALFLSKPIEARSFARCVRNFLSAD